jgi:hypothetical protein
MGTKRKVINRTQPPGGGGRITPEVIALFKQLREFERNPAARIREDGGCQREYRDLCERLDIALGFGEPWARFSPAHVRGNSKPPTWIREHEVADWKRTIEVRRELEQAVANERLKKAPAVT